MAGEELDKYMADEPETETTPAATPSEVVKPEVKQASDVPYVDEKGVPYFNRFKEMSEKLDKFKDVDPDRWSKLKDFDPDQVARALELERFMTSDKEKFQKALALYEEQQEEAAKEESAGEKKYLTAEDFDKLMRQREEGHVRNQWMTEWNKQVDSSMTTVLKGDSFKDFGDLHERDKRAVVQEVGEVFEKDANSRMPKLSLKDVPQVVGQVIKSLYEYRQSIRGQAIKKDVSPQSISGNRTAESHKKPEGEYDENEDTKDMISLYKELSNPHI
jgi:hypothetical protein